MLRLQLYILRRLLGSLLLILLITCTIFFVGQAVQILGRTPDVGVEFVLGLLPMFVPVTLSLTLPLSFLIAVILTYGRLADDNEILAMRMAGIHPWAMAAPGVFAGAALSFFCLDLQGNVSPAALRDQDRVRQDIYRRFVEVIERGARNSFVNKDFKISWQGVRDGELEEIHISKGGAGEQAQETHAERGILQKAAGGRTLVFTLKRGILVAGEGNAWTVTRFEEIVYEVSAPDLLSVHLGLANPRVQSQADLLFRMARWPPGSENHVRFAVELFGRIAMALAPLAFALCAVPLALLVGKGSRAAAAILAFGVALVFYLLWELGGTLAGKGSLPPAPALLASDGILFLAGGVLLRKVVRQ